MRALRAPCPCVRASSSHTTPARATRTFDFGNRVSRTSTSTTRARRRWTARATSDDDASSDIVRSRARAAVERATRALESDDASGSGDEADEAEDEATTTRSMPTSGRVERRDLTREIRLIVTDVDGTLLNSRQELSARAAAALRDAAELGVPTVVATGKTRGPWARALYEELGEENRKMPGLFIQGLVVCDGRGIVLKSRTLEKAGVKDILRFAKTRDSVVVAFCGEQIVCSTRNEYTDKVLDYGEPEPLECGDLLAKSDEFEVNKLLLFGEDDAVARFRAEAETILADVCDITVAVPGMLEFLPKGASKGSAVRDLCEVMDIDLADVLAIGDGENDKEMLMYAGLGIAVGNASSVTKSVADVVMEETNDEDAVAKAVEVFVLEPRRLPDGESQAPPREDVVIDAGASGDWLNSRAEALDEARVRAEKEARSRARQKVKSAKEKVEYKKFLERQSTVEERQAAEAELEDELMSKIVAEEKFVGFIRAFTRGAQRFGESITQDSREGDEEQISDEDRTNPADVESMKRQRERLMKLQIEFEATKAALEAQKRASGNSVPSEKPTQFEEDQAARDFIRSETNKITARTSLKKAAAKAAKDAKKSNTNIVDVFASALKSVSNIDTPQRRAERDAAKSRLLALLVNADGGRDCDDDTMSRLMSQVKILEASNPTKKSARSPLMLGLWSCAFTNCPQILGTQQGLSMSALRQKNAVAFFRYNLDAATFEIDRGWPMRRLSGKMSYRDDSSVELDIPKDTGLFGAIGMSLSSEKRNYTRLTVSYIDTDLKICRGRNDTIYIFVNNDPTYRSEN